MTQPVVGRPKPPHATGQYPLPEPAQKPGDLTGDPYLHDSWVQAPDVTPLPEKGSGSAPDEGVQMRSYQVSVPSLRAAEESIGRHAKDATAVYNSLRSIAERDTDLGEHLELLIPSEKTVPSGTGTGVTLDLDHRRPAPGFIAINQQAKLFSAKITSFEQPLLEAIAYTIYRIDQFREAIQLSLQDYASADAHSMFSAP